MSLPISISVISISISAFALGWNIYRDVIVRNRLRVYLRIKINGSGNSVNCLVLEIVSMSKHPVMVDRVLFLKLRPFRRVESKEIKLLPGQTCLPKPLVFGEKSICKFGFDQLQDFERYGTVGVVDTFNVMHRPSKLNVYKIRLRLKRFFKEVNC